MYGTESRKALKQDVPGAPDIQQPSIAGDDDKKTPKQLLDELAVLRQRVKDLEAFESERKAIASELKGTRQRLQYLLAVSPLSSTRPRRPAITPAPSSAKISALSWVIRRRR